MIGYIQNFHLRNRCLCYIVSVGRLDAPNREQRILIIHQQVIRPRVCQLRELLDSSELPIRPTIQSP
jgi:hypothetical protein